MVVIIIITCTEYVPEMRFSAAVRFFTQKRYGDTNQPTATFESATADNCYAVRYIDVRQSATTAERGVGNNGRVVIYRIMSVDLGICF